MSTPFQIQVSKIVLTVSSALLLSSCELNVNINAPGSSPSGSTVSPIETGEGFASGPFIGLKTAYIPPNWANQALAIDSHGNIFVADPLGYINKINPAGISTRFAGSGACGVGPEYSRPCQSDGVGDYASFQMPYAVAIDNDDNLYVAERGAGNTGYIRTITPFADVTTLTSINGICYGLAVDSQGNIFCSSSSASSQNASTQILKIDPSGTVTTFAGSTVAGFHDALGLSARFNDAGALAIDASDNLFVVDGNNHVIRKIAPDGQVTTFAGNGAQGYLDGEGRNASFLFGGTYSWSRGGLGIDSAGNLFLIDMPEDYTGNQAGYVRKISPTGTVTTYCGNGSTAARNATGSCANSGVVGTALTVGYDNTVYFISSNQVLRITE